jgi:hypothetical protein
MLLLVPKLTSFAWRYRAGYSLQERRQIAGSFLHEFVDPFVAPHLHGPLIFRVYLYPNRIHGEGVLFLDFDPILFD